MVLPAARSRQKQWPSAAELDDDGCSVPSGGKSHRNVPGHPRVESGGPNLPRQRPASLPGRYQGVAGGYFEPRTRAWTSFLLHVETVTGKQLPPWEVGAATFYTGMAGNVPVAFSPDGTRAAVVVELGWPEGQCLLARDLAAGRPLARVSGGFSQWIAVAPDNRTAVMTEANRIVGRDLVSGSVTRALDSCPRPRRRGPFS